MGISDKKVKYLIVDTTAFIQNAPLQDIADKIITCPEVVNEITNKRQLRRLVTLPYDLEVKNVFPENIKIVTDFSIKTGDYQSLSATDIKVIALTYQIEKENVGVDHLRTEPIIRPSINIVKKSNDIDYMTPDVTGFYLPGYKKDHINDISKEDVEQSDDQKIHNESISSEINDELIKKFETIHCDENEYNNDTENDEILVPIKESSNEGEGNAADFDDYDEDDDENDDDDDDGGGWITPSNIKIAQKQINSQLIEDKHVTVACITTDFAMQNVLKQMNLNVSALDGRMIKQIRTFILRCYTCFKTTSIMTKIFCPKCGNNTLKKVAVSLDENGKMQIHINAKRPLTGRGKKFSIPRIKGGKHPNNPILVEDQPMPDNRPTRLASTKNRPLDDDYIAGFSPFIMRDVNSKSAQLKIRPNEVKRWMQRNPNEARRKRK